MVFLCHREKQKVLCRNFHSHNLESKQIHLYVATGGTERRMICVSTSYFSSIESWNPFLAVSVPRNLFLLLCILCIFFLTSLSFKQMQGVFPVLKKSCFAPISPFFLPISLHSLTFWKSYLFFILPFPTSHLYLRGLPPWISPLSLP